MKKFYIHNGKDQLGPFSPEELEQQGITKSTPVWYPEADDWKEAGKIAELNNLFINTTPPPFKGASRTYSNLQIAETKPKKKFRLVKLLLIAGGLVLAVMVVSAIGTKLSGNGNPSVFSHVMTPEEQEKADPTRYLNASGKYKTNFWGNKVNLEGLIVSAATVVNFKDVLIRVEIYNSDQATIFQKDVVIYDYIPARGSREFKLKLDWPSGAKTCGWSVINATPY